MGYQNKEQCFIATDLFDSGRNKEVEKLRITKDRDFYLAWTGRAYQSWITEIYNYHTKEEFLKGDLCCENKEEMLFHHPKIWWDSIFLPKSPIGMLSVDINLPKLYFGEINQKGAMPAIPMEREQVVILGGHSEAAFKLIEGKKIPSSNILSEMEKIVLDLGEMYPQSIRGLTSYSITKGSIRQESYQGI